MARLVGPYRIEKQLGRGGFGDLYHAFDERLERDVALMLLPTGVAHSADTLERLVSDAFLASSVVHPGIARVYDVGEHDGQPFFAFEYVEGQTLADRPARGPLPIVEAVTMAIAISDALAEAHARGLVHLDLSPARVVITGRGRPKILGVGPSSWAAARMAHARVTADPATAVMATHSALEYLSPEQALGEAGDARSDVFSLGAIVYEMVTGRRAFEAATPTDLLLAILKSVPVPPSRLNPAVPRSLDTIVAGCLAKSLDVRTQRATQVGDALRELAHEPPSVAARGASRGGIGRHLSRRTLRRGIVVLAACACAGATAAWLLAPTFKAVLSRVLR